MINSTRGTRGMAVAPHSVASQSALAVLREGGNALEAMIAACATIAVAYPHMNSIGGDSFWLISVPGEGVRAIDACGAAAAGASREWYLERGHAHAIPARGGPAALTVAGTISGWELAYAAARELGGRMPLTRLLADAIDYAERGIPVTASQTRATSEKRGQLEGQPGYSSVFLPQGRVPAIGSLFAQPRLAATLRHLAQAGLDDFYRGELADSMAEDLQRADSPLRVGDLRTHRARWKSPLVLEHSMGQVYNMPPPTQGLVSLLVLGQLDLLGVKNLEPQGADFVHLAVEATKRAFSVRDRYITDPVYMNVEAQGFLSPTHLRKLADGISRQCAAPWPGGKGPGDTVWMGVIDADGYAVSCIQSIYHEFGAGIVLERSGVNWHNRGVSFALAPGAQNALMPGRKPFHTLNPALAQLHDGRTLVYGTMGGDGQPQTQAAIFSRYANFGLHPQAAISAPRWVLGRTWGDPSESLKLEARFAPEVVDRLRALGHEVELLRDVDETVGHAGLIVRHADGSFEGGADPRSDGSVAAF